MAGNVTADIKNDLAIINSEAQRAAVIVKKPPDICQKACTGYTVGSS